MCTVLYILVALLAHQVTAFTNDTVEEIPESYLNLSAGDALWHSLFKNCRKPTLACVENSMFAYLKDTLDYPDDVQVAAFMNFKRNTVDYGNLLRIVGDKDGNDGTEEARKDDVEDAPGTALEEVSRALHGKTVEFLMTHDVELHLPDTVFEGSVLKLSPRAFEGGGALVKVEFLPRQMVGAVGESRLFKKLKKFITDRLIYALLAILLIIKLLAAKFMFFMPMMVGAVAAKKLLLKVLLFVFPVLKHIFKLCPYVPHGTKYHHHKHQIAHFHHVAGHHGHHSHPHHGPVEVIAPHADGPPSHDWHGQPSLSHFSDIDPPHRPSYNPHEHEVEYYSGGPALVNHFISHRDDLNHDENEIQPWGQGQNKPKTKRPITPTEIENMVLKAEKEALIKARLQQEKLRIQEENMRLQEQLKQALRLQEKLKVQAVAVTKGRVGQGTHPPKLAVAPPPSPFLQTPAPPKVHPASQYTVEKQQHVVQQQEMIHHQVGHQPGIVRQQQTTQSKPNAQLAFEQALHQAASITYDPFYSPILEKIDKIFVGLGFNDESCRERLVCSMYKNPAKFSPHSNHLSAELSRDSKELQKPTTTNAAVIRFYRYVQAARDGQDKRECLRLYANCATVTE